MNICIPRFKTFHEFHVKTVYLIRSIPRNIFSSNLMMDPFEFKPKFHRIRKSYTRNHLEVISHVSNHCSLERLTQYGEISFVIPVSEWRSLAAGIAGAETFRNPGSQHNGASIESTQYYKCAVYCSTDNVYKLSIISNELVYSKTYKAF